ncbi:hypothetical protein B5E64_10735 [Drancourtella sp. An12]|uniref:hypothetical protein n=1 Tax=Drancourtella sp. An12 TaxID=1965548 RepID=UPI000B3B07EB|nr:hypothetical protein [Drancourtella sp. An12]OUQ45169.1 hypothetical protein B5E64_10735 [Drancourtella sp. An12]
MDCKKILVISQNPFDECSNNGKTLLSFFSGYPKDKIAQLYLHEGEPLCKEFDNFFRITEKDILYNIFGMTKKCGKKISNRVSELIYQESKETKWKTWPLIRLMREVVWKLPWNKKELFCWLDKYKPEVIFSTCGDTLFTYYLTRLIKKRYHSSLAVFITDDYIMPRKNIDIFWQFKRSLIKKNIKRILKEANYFFTISEGMCAEYKKIFQKKSYVIMNMEKITKVNVPSKHSDLVLVYAGNLEYNRDKVLAELSKIIYQFNLDNKRKVRLETYTNSSITENLREKLCLGENKYGGKLAKKDLEVKLNEADIFVHVEAFDKKNIYDTRFSISTKIYEYLSLGKPILAIGPENIASMQFLKDTACCINDPKYMEKMLNIILSDEKKRKVLAKKSEELFNAKKQAKEEFWKILNE